jgi:two-component system phosphate regulon sensor histidine kinase PhoR
MHEVSMAITSSIVATNEVLSEIAERAARWLGADAAGVFLSRSNQMQLVAVHQLPLSWVACSVEKQDSLVNHVVQSKTAIYLENYARDWHGSDDLPLAKLAYGSVICVPLVYGHKVIGALMVIAGRKGRLFDRSDADLLELLASQAAVAISYRELFSEQRMLTNQLKIAHDQLRTVLSSTDSPVIAIDRNLKLIFTNPAAETLFRLNTLQEKISVTDVIPPVALPLDRREAISHLMQSRTYQYEFDFDGRTFLCHVATLGEQRMEGFVAVLNDISQFKELDRLKSEMVRMTSHDLKNPLQAAMANVELLKDDLTDNQHDEALLSANVIEKQLYKMNRIISGILDLERVRLGSKPTLLCEPAAIIERAVSELVDYATDQKVTIESSIAPDTGKFVGDQEQFIRAIGNLIENAIKFNHADGKVSIEVTKQIDRIVFSVCDTGIGIPQNLHDRIFDRFFRGHQSGAEHISGSGLGLSLVKSVADSHNGQLWFKSTPGQGTIFYLSVPVATNPGVEST